MLAKLQTSLLLVIVWILSNFFHERQRSKIYSARAPIKLFTILQGNKSCALISRYFVILNSSAQWFKSFTVELHHMCIGIALKTGVYFSSKKRILNFICSHSAWNDAFFVPLIYFNLCLWNVRPTTHGRKSYVPNDVVLK